MCRSSMRLALRVAGEGGVSRAAGDEADAQ